MDQAAPEVPLGAVIDERVDVGLGVLLSTDERRSGDLTAVQAADIWIEGHSVKQSMAQAIF